MEERYLRCVGILRGVCRRGIIQWLKPFGLGLDFYVAIVVVMTNLASFFSSIEVVIAMIAIISRRGEGGAVTARVERRR